MVRPSMVEEYKVPQNTHRRGDTAPGEADQHVPGCQPGVVPPHAAVLVQQQGEGLVPVGGEDGLVRAGLWEPAAPR